MAAIAYFLSPSVPQDTVMAEREAKAGEQEMAETPEYESWTKEDWERWDESPEGLKAHAEYRQRMVLEQAAGNPLPWLDWAKDVDARGSGSNAASADAAGPGSPITKVQNNRLDLSGPELPLGEGETEPLQGLLILLDILEAVEKARREENYEYKSPYLDRVQGDWECVPGPNAHIDNGMYNGSRVESASGQDDAILLIMSNGWWLQFRVVSDHSMTRYSSLSEKTAHCTRAIAPAGAAEETFWIGKWHSSQILPNQDGSFPDPCEFHRSQPPLIISKATFADCSIIEVNRTNDKTVRLKLSCAQSSAYGDQVLISGDRETIFVRPEGWGGAVHGMGRCK